MSIVLYTLQCRKHTGSVALDGELVDGIVIASSIATENEGSSVQTSIKFTLTRPSWPPTLQCLNIT